MFSIKMISFCKNKDCPPSQELVAFQNGETSSKKSNLIREHLAACEFCASEVEFYARYPLEAEETVAEAEIPPPLFELAQALFCSKEKNVRILNKLMLAREKLFLEKV